MALYPSMIFVTGASGFVGRRVLVQLRQRAQRAAVLVRRGSHAEPETTDILRVHGSLENPDSYRRHLAGVHTVIHLASKNLDDDGQGFARTNVVGTRALGVACRDMGVRHVVYLSSTGVYGHRRFHGADESTPLRPDTSLSRSKAAAEAVLRDEFANDFATTVLRPRFIHGPGDRHFLPALTHIVERYPLLPVSGKARMSLVHVDDLADICVRVADLPSTGFQAMHVTDQRVHSLASLLETIARARQVRATRFVPIPFACLYLPLRTLEFLRGTDPDRRSSGLTSLRLRFLAQDNCFASDRLAQKFPDMQYRRFEETVRA